MTVDVPGIPTTEEPLPLAEPVDPTRPEVHLTPGSGHGATCSRRGSPRC